MMQVTGTVTSVLYVNVNVGGEIGTSYSLHTTRTTCGAAVTTRRNKLPCGRPSWFGEIYRSLVLAHTAN